MKPKPFSALNHLTVPCAMGLTLSFVAIGNPHFAGPQAAVHNPTRRDHARPQKRKARAMVLAGTSSTCEELLGATARDASTRHRRRGGAADQISVNGFDVPTERG